MRPCWKKRRPFSGRSTAVRSFPARSGKRRRGSEASSGRTPPWRCAPAAGAFTRPMWRRTGPCLGSFCGRIMTPCPCRRAGRPICAATTATRRFCAVWRWRWKPCGWGETCSCCSRARRRQGRGRRAAWTSLTGSGWRPSTGPTTCPAFPWDRSSPVRGPLPAPLRG